MCTDNVSQAQAPCAVNRNIIVISSFHNDRGLPKGQRKCPHCNAIWVASGSEAQGNFTVERNGQNADSSILDLFGNNAAVACCLAG